MPDSFIAIVNPDADLAETAGKLRKEGVEVLHLLPKLHLIEARGDKAVIESLPEVDTVEENVMLGLDNT